MTEGVAGASMTAVLWALTCATAAAQSVPAWTTYQANASHDGYMPVTLNPKNFSLLWQKSLGTYALNPVTAADGNVFVSQQGRFNSGAGLHVLDANTGEEEWSTTFGSVNSVNPPAYADGKVYIQTGKGTSSPPPYLSAFDANTGATVFQSQFGAQWEGYYAPTPYAGNIYINGGYYGGAYAFNGTTGAQQWYAGLPQYDDWTPAVDQNYVYAYVGDYTPALYVLDRATGAQAYRIDDPNFSWSGWSMNLAPVLGGANDVLAIQNRRLISFDLANRNIRWEISRSFSGQPSVAGGVIYAIDGGVLTALNETTGQTVWTWGSGLSGTLIITKSHVLVGSTSTTYAVDLATHQATWSYGAGGQLALSQNTLYIANSSGTLTALDALFVPPPFVWNVPHGDSWGKSVV